MRARPPRARRRRALASSSNPISEAPERLRGAEPTALQPQPPLSLLLATLGAPDAASPASRPSEPALPSLLAPALGAASFAAAEPSASPLSSASLASLAGWPAPPPAAEEPATPPSSAPPTPAPEAPPVSTPPAPAPEVPLGPAPPVPAPPAPPLPLATDWPELHVPVEQGVPSGATVDEQVPLDGSHAPAIKQSPALHVTGFWPWQTPALH